MLTGRKSTTKYDDYGMVVMMAYKNISNFHISSFLWTIARIKMLLNSWTPPPSTENISYLFIRINLISSKFLLK